MSVQATMIHVAPRRATLQYASARSAFYHTHDRTSPEVRPANYDARAKGSRFLQVDPVEGGSCNDYDYGCADSINNFDLDGQRCWTGVAWRERVRYKDTHGKWKTKTKEHCNSVAKGVKRNARGLARGVSKAGRVGAKAVCQSARWYGQVFIGVATVTVTTNAGIVGGFAVGGPYGAFAGGAAGAIGGYYAGRAGQRWYYEHTVCPA